MPAILATWAWEAWLGPPSDDAAAFLAMLRPAPSDLLEVRLASPRVNSVANDGPELLGPPAHGMTSLAPDHMQSSPELIAAEMLARNPSAPRDMAGRDERP
jgi:hypothetical protein